MNSNMIGHFPLIGDCEDYSDTGLRVQSHGVTCGVAGPGSLTAAEFDGINSRIEVGDHPRLKFGVGDFSIAVWIHADGDVVGDIISKFDPATRRGFSLSVVTHSGMTSAAQSNHRNVHFGIDNGCDGVWTDCERPGKAVYVQALSVVKGELYAGTFEIGAEETGHLWRYAGDGQWEHCGATPDGSNGMSSVIEFDGALYCGTGRYNPNGSRLGDALNTNPGGRVYRVEPDGKWIDCGQPGAEDAVPEDTPTTGYETGKADEVTSLTVYRGELYCTSHHRRGAFKYEGGRNWKYIGPRERLMTFTVFQDKLYTLVNGGPVYRYEGDSDWTFCGTPTGSTQTYAGVTYAGQLYVGTWPEGEVFRYDGGESWTNVGRLGYEREVMAMALYNGKIYCGTLPTANVFRMDKDGFTLVGTLDTTPMVYLRRVWSMAVFQGKLFAGTLPSGRVWSFEAGRMATSDHPLPTGWHHLAAVREGNHLRLYVDGNLAAVSTSFNPSDYDLSNDQPLRIGFSVGHRFRGAMSDLRIYERAVTEEEVGQLVNVRERG